MLHAEVPPEEAFDARYAESGVQKWRALENPL
jgi:hypothetical protein